jgi:hypothetical protein
MEPAADAEPDQEGSSRRQFIRRLAAMSAGLAVAAPLARGVGDGGISSQDGSPG